MVKLKLNENYSNDFLTTIRGEIFYKDWLKQGRPEWVEVDDDIYNNDIELKKLVMQKTLYMKKDIENEVKKEDKIEKNESIKKDKIEKEKDTKEDKFIQEINTEIEDSEKY